MKEHADKLRDQIGEVRERADGVDSEKDSYWVSVAKTGQLGIRSATGQAFSKAHRPGTDTFKVVINTKLKTIQLLLLLWFLSGTEAHQN